MYSVILISPLRSFRVQFFRLYNLLRSPLQILINSTPPPFSLSFISLSQNSLSLSLSLSHCVRVRACVCVSVTVFVRVCRLWISMFCSLHARILCELFQTLRSGPPLSLSIQLYFVDP